MTAEEAIEFNGANVELFLYLQDGYVERVTGIIYTETSYTETSEHMNVYFMSNCSFLSGNMPHYMRPESPARKYRYGWIFHRFPNGVRYSFEYRDTHSERPLKYELSILSS